MSVLSSLFGKKKKPNLTPDVPRLQQSQLYFTGGNPGTDLRDLLSKRLFRGEGLGFGEDFVSRTTNPAIQASENYFKEKTLPGINSQLSARGLARSAGPNLATDVLGKAHRDQNNYVDQMVAEFYKLNEMQKKSDFSESLGAAQNLGQQEERMAENRAAASERLANATAAQQNAFRQEDRQLAGLGLQAGANLLSPGLGGIFSKLGMQTPSALYQGGNQSALNTFGVSGVTGSLSPRARTIDSQGLDAMNVQELLALFGG